MTRTILFIGGGAAPPHVIKRFMTSDTVVGAADSGYDSAVALGYRPEVVAGDMDSISDPESLSDSKEMNVHVYDTDKDETDTELLFRIMKDRGAKQTIIAGGGSSGRMDHELAILALFERDTYPDIWINDRAEIHCVDTATHAREIETGSTVSVFPVGNGPWKLSSEGLRWPLQKVEWSRSVAGVSNIALTPNISITVHSGRLLIVYPYEDI
ncbi:MAG: thiamine diphosphokinase [Spirochaetota bacterium]